MSTDFYFVCDECKEISDNALTYNMSGGYIIQDAINDFLIEHFLNRICPYQGIRIVSEQSIEDETYKNVNEPEGER